MALTPHDGWQDFLVGMTVFTVFVVVYLLVVTDTIGPGRKR